MSIIYIYVIKALYNETVTSLKTSTSNISEFPITTSLDQECSKFLSFGLVMDKLIGHFQDDISWCMIFVDDILLVDETRIEINCKLELQRCIRIKEFLN